MTPSLEFRMNGDYVIVTPKDEECIVELAQQICLNLDSRYRAKESDKEYLLENQSIRPGVFSLKLKKDFDTGIKTIHVQNLNGRGLEEYTTQLRKAVESL